MNTEKSHTHTASNEKSASYAEFQFSQEDWEQTPQSVQNFVLRLMNDIARFQKRVEELERRVNQDSSNSSKPPSSDSPYNKKKGKKDRRKSGVKKGHKGHRQVMLEPTETVPVKPQRCACGNTFFPETEPFHTHQKIELPEIQMQITHFILHQGKCPCCGKLNKAHVPLEHKTGYGPRLSAFIGEVCGIQGNSRTTIKEICASLLGFHISKGAIQKVIDRNSEAIKPHYEAIARVARNTLVNYIDETS